MFAHLAMCVGFPNGHHISTTIAIIIISTAATLKLKLTAS